MSVLAPDMSPWQYGLRRAVPFSVSGEKLVRHDCPVFGVAVVSEPPFHESWDGAEPVVVPLCGCYPSEMTPGG